MQRTALFDLDGTLVDSAPDLHAATDRLMARLGLPGFARAEIVAMVGDGARALVERALAARGRSFDADALADFLADYTAHSAVQTRPFPGIPEALDALAAAGWRLAVCTNKPEAATRALLEALGLLGRFAAIGAGDSFAVRKPDPGHLLATLRLAGGAPAAAVMVGDHRNDVAAALAADLPCVFATWGYGPPMMAEGAAALARTPGELPALLPRALAAARDRQRGGAPATR
ncbi:phosphoglycolate phosphatase, bacterial [Caldovatus sediminis]|uniref:Phosphoglycolate phosphatase n=1 Tax=Caldovatus sediminis TaxID=2041189 RepID=A0A8J2ZA20_9PROT|nr:phosphoglycolate phosphatase [Caldovatus sediminis]GGG28763.1 phosphoglycolate phosphatase, bacterial [Caldovatus sediminis]